MSNEDKRSKLELILSSRSIKVEDVARIADALLDGTTRTGRSDSRQCHRPVGSAAECDGLEDLPSARTTGNASHLSPGLHGRAGDMFQDQASSVAVLCGSLSKRDLHLFK